MSPETIIALLTLIALEVVLGIDNIIFISILAGKLPEHQQKKARRLGILLAAVIRIGLLTIIGLIMRLKTDLFNVFGIGISGKDLILILGGLFLIYKSSSEIYHKMEGEEADTSKNIKATTFGQVLVQILLMDIIFSVDSIITAVGMVSEIWIMYVAVIVTVFIMLVAAAPVSSFVNKHPAFKMLALSFLLLIGTSLIAEGFDFEIPKGYIYFSMAFSLLVDILQMRMKGGKGKPAEIHEHYTVDEAKLDKDTI